MAIAAKYYTVFFPLLVHFFFFNIFIDLFMRDERERERERERDRQRHRQREKQAPPFKECHVGLDSGDHGIMP